MSSKKLLSVCVLILIASITLGIHASTADSYNPASSLLSTSLSDWHELSKENVDQHCTVFYAADDHVALGGNNEDGYHPVLTRIWFIPPEEGRFGMALVGFDNFGNPEGAMNDQGLFFDGLAVRDVDVPLREGTQIYAGKAIMKIMSECGTVECALKFFNQYSLPGHWNGQWLIGDSHGNSAIIEPLTIVQKEGAFQVGTNFFQSEVPLADRTDARYVTATKMLSEADTFSIDLFRDTLNAVHQESNGVHTLYSTIYDLKQGLIYLYYFHDFEHVVTFDLKKELAKGIHSYDIPSLFTASSAAVELGGKTPAELAGLRTRLRQATVDPDLLRQYEGNYQLEVLPSYLDSKIYVKSENGRLFFRQPWTPWVEGIPQSNEDFIYLYSDPLANLHEVSLSFMKDVSGQVTKLEVSTDDSEKMRAIKLSTDATKMEGGTQLYLIVDLVLAALAAFSVYQIVRLAKTIRGQPAASALVIVLNLLLSLFILFGIPLMVGVLNGLPLQAGYKWDILFIAFPGLTIVLLGSSVLLFIATAGQILLRVQKRRMQT